MAQKPSPPTPPRLTGEQDADFQSLRQHASAFFQNTVIDTKLLDPAYQYDGGTFDPTNLFDPAESSIGMAQNTANNAYTTAAQGVSGAADAQATADQGVSDAATAAASAAAAAANAATAQTTATTGVTNAAAAQTTANTGVTNAATAQTTANTGVTNAAAAQTTANTAVTNAATAQSTANAAQATANAAYTHRVLLVTSVAVSGAGTTGSVSFSDPGVAFVAVVTPYSISGTPAAGSTTLVSVTPASTSVGVTVEVAPGGGNGVVFLVVLIAQ